MDVRTQIARTHTQREKKKRKKRRDRRERKARKQERKTGNKEEVEDWKQTAWLPGDGSRIIENINSEENPSINRAIVSQHPHKCIWLLVIQSFLDIIIILNKNKFTTKKK